MPCRFLDVEIPGRAGGEQVDYAMLLFRGVRNQLLVAELDLDLGWKPSSELGVHQQEQIPKERAEQRFEQVVVGRHGEILLSSYLGRGRALSILQFVSIGS